MAFWNRGKGEAHVPSGIDPEKIPDHIAIILDGNGRWAKKRGLPRTAGHAAGVDAFRTIAYYCRDLGVSHLTIYVFSTENWKRPPAEVSVIMKLLKKHMLEVLEKMERDGFKIHFLGDLSPISGDIRELCDEAISRSERLDDGHRLQVNVCLNYGGRDEIVRAAKAWQADVAAGKVKPEDLTEEVFSGYLDTAGIPDPDLLIRPSGELRLSNFLPWQSAYSEFWFSDILWPDFTPAMLDQAIADYQKRSRRFGGI